MVLLSQFAFESVFAHSGTIELPHNKTVFFYEISDGLIFVRNQMEPFMLVNVPLDNFYLSLEDISETYALVEHGRTHQHRLRCSNLLDLEIT
jgi:hypothetical protein